MADLQKVPLLWTAMKRRRMARGDGFLDQSAFEAKFARGRRAAEAAAAAAVGQREWHANSSHCPFGQRAVVKEAAATGEMEEARKFAVQLYIYVNI
jgi:hypothetical protein